MAKPLIEQIPCDYCDRPFTRIASTGRRESRRRSCDIHRERGMAGDEALPGRQPVHDIDSEMDEQRRRKRIVARREAKRQETERA